MWDEDRIKSLIASVSRSFPVGALMTLDTGGPVNFQPRPVEGAPTDANRTAPQSLLLDGQQLDLLRETTGRDLHRLFESRVGLQRANQRWAMDFVADTLAHGRTFRVLTIIDEHTRECLAVETDTNLPRLRVIRVLEQLAQTRGLPEEIHVDHGPEFVCQSVRSWCEARRVLLRYIEPGRPMQNGRIEAFNGRLRDECLNANWFLNLASARLQLESWRSDYNQARPHSSLAYRTPNKFATLLA